MRHHLGATWIDDESLAYNSYSGAPSTSRRRGLVRFPDGALRMVKLGVPDSFFTIPAIPVSGGRKGYVDVGDGEYEFTPPRNSMRVSPGGQFRLGARASASRAGQRMTGRVQKSGRRYERVPGGRWGGGITSAYQVWSGDRILGVVYRTARGWTALGPHGGVAVHNYLGSRDAAADYLGQARNKRRRRPAGSMIRRHKRTR